MGKITIPYKPREFQVELHNKESRWMVTVCHRRFGKTVYAVNKLIKSNFTCQHDSPRYAYIAPLLSQAKAIAWDYLKHYSRPIPGIKINEAELRVDYPNGGRIRLFGSDNPDALRGHYLDGVVYDEYAQVHPKLHSEVIRPALSDRSGWAEFMGTLNGRNHFWELLEHAKFNEDWVLNIYRASATKVLPQKELDDARKIMGEDEYLQEYECEVAAAVHGAYYAKELARLEADKRLCKVPIESSIPVNTFWDLGRNDTTAIWFHQAIGLENRFIDYYEASGEGLGHYAKVLKEKDYLYGRHYLPHDACVVELSRDDNKSREQILNDAGVKPSVVVKRISNINDGIEITRQSIGSCWIDIERCKEGYQALSNYQKEWDSKRQTFRSYPLHNWASNGADAFRQFAQGYRELKKKKQINYPKRCIA